MSDSIRFSIIIPTRNRAKSLARCLAALAQLDYPCAQFEILVVDDGGDQSLAKTFAPFQNALQISLLQQKRAGPAAARNLGAARANGTFLAFTDDDCTSASDWLRTLETKLNALPGCAVGGRTLNALTDNIFSTASELLMHYLYTYYNRDAERARFIASNNFAVGRAAFLEIGGFDATFPLAAAEDRDFCDRWLAHGNPLQFAPAAKVYHAHALTLRSFFLQHWGYGRGAWYFHRARARRGQGRIRFEQSRFYRDLVLYPFAQKLERAPLLALLLALTQIANMGGFFWERVRGQIT